MSVEIGRSLKVINAEVKKLEGGIKSATNQNRELDKSLKFDSKDLDALNLKSKNLTAAVDSTNQKLKLLKDYQKRASDELASGKISQASYDKLALDILKAEVQFKSFNRELKNTNEQLSKANASGFISSLENVNSKLEIFKSKIAPIARSAQLLIASVAGIGVAFAKTGSDIKTASDRYRISAEEFQRSSFVFSRATGNSNAYKQALEGITSQMSALNRGSSKAIANFEALGLSLDDVKGKSPAQVIEMITNRLSMMSDVEERAALATQLLGSSGVELAQVAGLGAEEIARLNAELEKQGILTQEEAEQAAALNDKLDNIKLTLKKVTAELAVGLMPVMQAIIKIINGFIPLLVAIGNTLQSIPTPILMIVSVLVMLVAVLPKMISGITAVNKALMLLGANPIALKLMLIAAAIAAVIFLIIKLAKWLGKVFGKKYSLDTDTSITGIDSPDLSYAVAAKDKAQFSNASYNNTQTTNYYDYSKSEYNIEKSDYINEEDLVERIESNLKLKLQVRR